MQRTFLLPLAALLLALPGLRAANAIATPPEEQLTYHTDARFGRVLFIRNEAAQPTASDAFWRAPLPPSPSGPILNTADLAQPEWAGAVATARDFLRWHAGEFLDDSRSRGRQSAPSPSPDHQRRLTSAAATNAFSPDTDLVPLRAERDALGMTHVRFTQTYRGLPVFGADATVHLAADGRVSSAGARLAPDIQVDIQPALTREQAVTVAVALWQAQFQRTETPEAMSTRLCLLAPDLLKNDGNPTTHLVWEVKLILTCKGCPIPQSNEHYYVDAHTGELREQISGIQRLDRRIYDCSANPGSSLCYSSYVGTNGYHYGRREGESSWGMNPRYNAYDTDTLYDLLGNVHAYLALKFGRDGANGQGGLGNGSYDPYSRTPGEVYLNDVAGNDPSCIGAFYQMGLVGFCAGCVIPDVVAHEYMHGLADYSVPGGLNYSGQSGTLNESQSDVWGQLFEKYLVGTTDWVFWPSGSVAGRRELADPPLLTYALTANPDFLYNYPDRFYSAGVHCGGADSGGVHINSTVVSKGAYLIAEGGMFNGCTIAGIGTDKLEQILYRVVTQYYSSSASFNSAYYNWIQSAADLYGADSPECLQTRRALQSVELDQPGYCSGLPARPPPWTPSAGKEHPMKHHEIHESHEKVGGSPVPQGRPRIAHRFNGGFRGASGASPVRDERNAVPIRQPGQSLLPSLPGLAAFRTLPPSDESLGYSRSSLRDLPRLLSCVSCLSWFLLVFAAFAQPVTVLDRIGTNSVSTDNNPGGTSVHYAHGTANELWGTCGAVWTQPFNGTLAEAAFVGFARVVNATNGMLLDPVTNLSAFAMSVHLWTNGAAGFLAGTNSGHGDVAIPLGDGPAAPQLWGVTAMTNSVVNSTNRYISVLPTFRVATNLSALNLRLQAGREYVVALVFEGTSGNVLVRQSFATTTGAPDLLAHYAGPGSLKTGPSTNSYNRTQFATRITVLPDAPVTLAITQRAAGLDISWPPMALPPELWTTTNLAGGPWSLWPDPLVTNFLSITNATGQQYFRLRMP